MKYSMGFACKANTTALHGYFQGEKKKNLGLQGVGCQPFDSPHKQATSLVWYPFFKTGYEFHNIRCSGILVHFNFVDMWTWKEAGENFTVRNFHDLYCSPNINGAIKPSRTQWPENVPGKKGRKMNTGFPFFIFSKNLTSRNYSEYVGANRGIILKCIVMKYFGRGAAGLIRTIIGLAIVWTRW